MALKMKLEQSTGESAEYIRVGKVELENGRVRLRLDLYLDQAAREQGKAPISHLAVIADGTKLLPLAFIPEDPNGNLREQAYNFLKTLSAYEGAEDM